MYYNLLNLEIKFTLNYKFYEKNYFNAFHVIGLSLRFCAVSGGI